MRIASFITVDAATRLLPRILFAAAAFVLLAVAIVRQPQYKLDDFDQSFYTTIAYDLDRYGVFSHCRISQPFLT